MTPAHGSGSRPYRLETHWRSILLAGAVFASLLALGALAAPAAAQSGDEDVRPTYEATLPADGDVHAVGVPAGADVTLEQALVDDESVAAVYALENGTWTQQPYAEESVPIGSTDALAVVTEANGSDVVLELPVPTGPANSSYEADLEAGWNFVSTPGYVAADEAFGDNETLSVRRPHAAPDAPAVAPGDEFATFPAENGTENDTVSAPTLAPTGGYYVYAANATTVEANASGLAVTGQLTSVDPNRTESGGIADGAVTAEGPENVTLSTETGHDGGYGFFLDGPGSYDLAYAAGDHENATQTVNATNTTTVDEELEVAAVRITEGEIVRSLAGAEVTFSEIHTTVSDQYTFSVWEATGDGEYRHTADFEDETLLTDERVYFPSRFEDGDRVRLQVHNASVENTTLDNHVDGLDAVDTAVVETYEADASVSLPHQAVAEGDNGTLVVVAENATTDANEVTTSLTTETENGTLLVGGNNTQQVVDGGPIVYQIGDNSFDLPGQLPGSVTANLQAGPLVHAVNQDFELPLRIEEPERELANDTATVYDASVDLNASTVEANATNVTLAEAMLLDGSENGTEFSVELRDDDTGDVLGTTNAPLTGANENVTVAVDDEAGLDASANVTATLLDANGDPIERPEQTDDSWTLEPVQSDPVAVEG